MQDVPRIGSLVLALAACGGTAGPISNISSRPDRGAGDLAPRVAFAPVARTDLLAKHSLPVARASALLATVPPGARLDRDGAKTNAYDLDRDGVADLVEFAQVMYGPSDGWIVYVRDGARLREAFAISGEWVDEVEDAAGVALRFEANVLAPGEARFSTVLRYDRGARDWDTPIKAYAALQGKIPPPHAPFEPFETVGAATLRATPAIDDAPATGSDDAFDATATLRGNVLAAYGARARGVVVASERDWRYVAFDPATRPRETSLGHGMDATDDEPAVEGEHKLRATTWLCGWIRAAEIR